MDQQIKTDISEIKSDINEIKVTMGINTKSLELHIKRTDELQDLVEEFKQHIILVNSVIKVTAAIGTIIVILDQLGILSRLF